jgi:transcriptional regulator with XRE-family HTH domain
MNFQDLHERLRLELLGRIESGGLTGTALARQSNFRQAHISNFLNGKRALSLEGLDRVLAAQGLTVDQLMPLELSAAAEPVRAGEMEAVPVVTPATAMNEPVVRPGAVIETVQVPAAGLRSNRWWAPEKYVRWQRYVAVRADAQQAAAMASLITPGAVAVVDRHYRSLAAYHLQQRTLYAVRTAAGLVLRHVELHGETMVLRPLALAVPVQMVTPGPQESAADYIVGRVCMMVAEL